jgi:hypothetical protein
MEKVGYPTEEARCFANDGCWETQVPGKTYFTYSPFDSLAILQQKTLGSYEGEISFDSFEELYSSLPLLKCGYTEEDVDGAHFSDMEEYYSAEEQKRYGVLGIEIVIQQ